MCPVSVRRAQSGDSGSTFCELQSEWIISSLIVIDVAVLDAISIMLVSSGER